MNPQEPTPQLPEQPLSQSGAQLPPLSQQNQPVTPPYPQPAPAPQPYMQPQTTNHTPTPAAQYNNEYPIDYLDRIAPQEQRNINKVALIGLIGGIVLAAIFAVILFLGSRPQSVTTQIPALALRISTLQSVTTEQQPHLNGTKVSEANAALGSSLSTMNTTITTIMKDRKIKESSKDTAAKEKTYLEKLQTTLNDSYQKGTLDRTYLSQMSYELSLLRSKLSTLKNSSNNSTISTFCDESIKSLDLITKAYENASSGES